MKKKVDVPRVVIIGAGFAGINAAKALAKMPVHVVLVDKKNHHTFQPFLYQVAMAGLSPAQIATPIRTLLRDSDNTEVVLGEVSGIDLENRSITVRDLRVEYDYLIIAAGASHTYFSRPEWEKNAPGLKTIEDAIEIRRRVFLAFEIAELEALAAGEHKPLNFVVIGAGATGVELAGSIADISKKYMGRDFRAIQPHEARVILLERGPRVLPVYPEALSAAAKLHLEELGVEVHINSEVLEIDVDCVTTSTGTIPSAVVLWAAGVKASSLSTLLNVPTDRAGRVVVGPDLAVPGYPEVFVLGDMAAAQSKGGKMVPGVAPAAIQMGRFAGRQIARSLQSKVREEFVYDDKGDLATIGIFRAVAKMGQMHLTGFPAWFLWLFVHLCFLGGLRNRLIVLVEWVWSYVTFAHGSRIITTHRLHHSEPVVPGTRWDPILSQETETGNDVIDDRMSTVAD